MKVFMWIACIFGLSACASPRVWLSKDDGSSGVVSYENYDPTSDNNQRISAVIPCHKYKMTANPIYRMGNGSTGYYMSNGVAIPLDSGYTERAEYHYECL